MNENKFYLYRGRFSKSYYQKDLKTSTYDNPIYNIGGAIVIGYGCFFYIISKIKYNTGKMVSMRSKNNRFSLFGKIKERKCIHIANLLTLEPPEYYPFIRLDSERKIKNLIIFQILERKNYKEIYE